MPLTIYVDSDACPVKDEVVRVAGRYQLNVIFVSNQGMRPRHLPNVSNVIVGAEFDAADNWIVEHATSTDIVVTSDILLADRCITQGSKALSPTGKIFSAQNIGTAKAGRELSAHLRETGEVAGYNRSFSARDRSQFLQSLDVLIQKSR
jgi:uncharacterized protein YaiI (UPF0178 family)